MGSQTTKISENKIEFIQDIKHPAFGPVKLFQSKKSKKKFICIRAKEAPSSPEQRCDLDHTNLINAITYDNEFYEVFGLSNAGLNFYFEYYELSLDQQISQNRVLNQRFSTQEIMQVCTDILQAMIYLNNQGITVGDIEPCLIYYDPILKVYKIYDNSLILGKYGALTIIEEGCRLRPVYANPEIIFTLTAQSEGLQYIKEHIYKADIFQLGMTLLEMATLLPSQELFDVVTKKTFSNIIDQRLLIVQQVYGERIHKLIKDTLIVDPNHRPDAEEIYRRITDKRAFYNQIRYLNNGPNNIRTRSVSQMAQQNSGIFSSQQQQVQSPSVLHPSTHVLHNQPVTSQSFIVQSSPKNRQSFVGTHTQPSQYQQQPLGQGPIQQQIVLPAYTFNQNPHQNPSNEKFNEQQAIQNMLRQYQSVPKISVDQITISNPPNSQLSGNQYTQLFPPQQTIQPILPQQQQSQSSGLRQTQLISQQGIINPGLTNVGQDQKSASQQQQSSSSFSSQQSSSLLSVQQQQKPVQNQQHQFTPLSHQFQNSKPNQNPLGFNLRGNQISSLPSQCREDPIQTVLTNQQQPQYQQSVQFQIQQQQQQQLLQIPQSQSQAEFKKQGISLSLDKENIPQVGAISNNYLQMQQQQNSLPTQYNTKQAISSPTVYNVQQQLLEQQQQSQQQQQQQQQKQQQQQYSSVGISQLNNYYSQTANHSQDQYTQQGGQFQQQQFFNSPVKQASNVNQALASTFFVNSQSPVQQLNSLKRVLQPTNINQRNDRVGNFQQNNCLYGNSYQVVGIQQKVNKNRLPTTYQQVVDYMSPSKDSTFRPLTSVDIEQEDLNFHFLDQKIMDLDSRVQAILNRSQQITAQFQ